MKVSVVFDITPQEAIELVQGTSGTMHKEVTERVTKAMLEGTTSAYKEAVQKANPSMLDPMNWWGKQK